MHSISSLVCETGAMSPLNLEIYFDRRAVIGEINEWVSSELKKSARKIEHLCMTVVARISTLDGKEEDYRTDSVFHLKERRFHIPPTGPFLASLAKLISGSKGYWVHVTGDLYDTEKEVFSHKYWYVRQDPT